MTKLEIEDIYYDVTRLASDEGYNVEIDDDLNIKLSHKDSRMPKIEVKTERMGEEYMYTPIMKFPDLSYTSDDFADTIPWYLERWARVGQFCQSLYLFVYNPSDYEE